LKMLAKAKHSSLFCCIINYQEERLALMLLTLNIFLIVNVLAKKAEAVFLVMWDPSMNEL
jgi:hypothetical protein